MCTYGCIHSRVCVHNTQNTYVSLTRRESTQSFHTMAGRFVSAFLHLFLCVFYFFYKDFFYFTCFYTKFYTYFLHVRVFLNVFQASGSQGTGRFFDVNKTICERFLLTLFHLFTELKIFQHLFHPYLCLR